MENLEQLFELVAIPGPSGREAAVATYVERVCQRVEGAGVRRTGDMVLASRGRPRTAVLAHLDTVGFTLGYGGALIPIGGPSVEGGERLRPVELAGGARPARVKAKRDREFLAPARGQPPGSGWVFADPLRQRGNVVTGPYLDNRAGVWSALRVLERAPDVLVVFTVAEEHSGRGALVAARLLHDEYRIAQAIISDITWHTDHVRCGKGPAVSLRDRYVPRQAFLERVLRIAEDSGVPFQREIESSGSSDGGWLERSSYPVDWVFVGAPEKRSHTPREELDLRDLAGMVDLTVALVEAL